MAFSADVIGLARSVRRAPGATLMVVLTLGLAIGANASIFSLIDRVAIRPLPVANPHQLVAVTAPSLPFTGFGVAIGGGRLRGIDYPLARAFEDGLSNFLSASAIRRVWRRCTLDAETSVPVVAEFVNAGYFTTFGLHAAVGRTFTAAEAVQGGGSPLVVLNHGFWMRQFAGDRTIVNRTIRLNRVPVTVIGVLAPGYSGTTVGTTPEMFLPLSLADQVAPSKPLAWDAPALAIYMMVARLRPGVDRNDAERAARALYQRLLDEARARGARVSEKEQEYFRANPVQLIPAGTVGSQESGVTRTLELPLRLLLAMTVFVLVVAAGNVANLLLARGVLSAHDTTIRLALGARRWDLLRPRLVESLALALGAGAAALLFAVWAGQLVPPLLGVGNDLAGVDTRPDARVVGFTAAVSLATGVFVWLASALFLTRRRAVSELAASQVLARGGATALGLRRALVILQVGLSLALLCASALLSRSLVNVLSVDPGFDAEGLAVFTVDPGSVGYRDGRLADYERTLLERLRALPGVTGAATTSSPPLVGGSAGTFVHGGRDESDSASILVDVVEVNEAYFATLGQAVVGGRSFDSRDTPGAPQVCIVNEALAHRLVGDGDWRGQRLGYQRKPAEMQLVGVVRDTRNQSLRRVPSPTLYLPRAQARPTGPVGVLVKAATSASLSAGAIGGLVKAVDPSVAMTGFGSLVDLSRAVLLRERMLAGLSVIFAGLSAVLAAMGLFGLASFNVTRRTREIGIRLALGATRGAVQGMVLREVMALAVAGAAMGLGLFAVASRILRSLLFEVTPGDPAMIGAGTLILALVASAAGYLPARRAARVDPAVTLRDE